MSGSRSKIYNRIPTWEIEPNQSPIDLYLSIAQEALARNPNIETGDLNDTTKNLLYQAVDYAVTIALIAVGVPQSWSGILQDALDQYENKE